MFDYQRYGIALDQVYVPADGSKNRLIVKDVEEYAEVGDVIVFDEAQGELRRIDAFKLAKVRYQLEGTPDTSLQQLLELMEEARTRHPALPLAVALPFIERALNAARQQEREACAKALEMPNSQLLLMGGEMTAQELRTVQAVLTNRATVIRRGDFDVRVTKAKASAST
jgi:hypothetical protein